MARRDGTSKREDIVRQIQSGDLSKQESRKFRALANKGYNMDWAAGIAQTTGGGTYTVKPGESWYSIAGDVYGDQRFFEQLMSANYGGYPLQPGAKINLPRVTGVSPTVSYDAMVRTLQLDQGIGKDVSGDITKINEYIATTNPDSRYSVGMNDRGIPALYRSEYGGGGGETSTGTMGGSGTTEEAQAAVQPYGYNPNMRFRSYTPPQEPFMPGPEATGLVPGLVPGANVAATTPQKGLELPGVKVTNPGLAIGSAARFGAQSLSTAAQGIRKLATAVPSAAVGIGASNIQVPAPEPILPYNSPTAGGGTTPSQPTQTVERGPSRGIGAFISASKLLETGEKPKTITANTKEILGWSDTQMEGLGFIYNQNTETWDLDPLAEAYLMSGGNAQEVELNLLNAQEAGVYARPRPGRRKGFTGGGRGRSRRMAYNSAVSGLVNWRIGWV